MLLWVGCIAGALDESDYRAKLAAAGFEAIGIEPTRVYKVDDAREFLAGKGLDVDALAPASRRQVHERVRSRGEAEGGADELERIEGPGRAGLLNPIYLLIWMYG